MQERGARESLPQLQDRMLLGEQFHAASPYMLGEMGENDVYMVQSEPGSSAALTAISRAIKDFSPSYIIMVGVAFG